MMLGPTMTLVTQIWWWPAGEKVGRQVPGSSLHGPRLGKEG